VMVVGEVVQIREALNAELNHEDLRVLRG